MAEPAELLDPMLPAPHRVRWARRESDETVTLALDAVEGEPIASTPGQFNMLYAFGVGEVPISVSGDPAEPTPLIHTIRDVGAVSGALCRAAQGDVIGVRGAYGTGWALDDAEGLDVVVVAGGLGLAPLRPVVLRVLAERDRFGRLFLVVGSRSPELLLFRDELEEWASLASVAVTVDQAAGEWRGHVGVVTELIPDAAFDPARAMGFVCGPEVMMRFAARALADRGVPRERIRVSMERNMKCAVGHCGHCQLGPAFVCRDGPVFPYDRAERMMAVREL